MTPLKLSGGAAAGLMFVQVSASYAYAQVSRLTDGPTYPPKRITRSARRPYTALWPSRAEGARDGRLFVHELFPGSGDPASLLMARSQPPTRRQPSARDA